MIRHVFLSNPRTFVLRLVSHFMKSGVESFELIEELSQVSFHFFVNFRTVVYLIAVFRQVQILLVMFNLLVKIFVESFHFLRQRRVHFGLLRKTIFRPIPNLHELKLLNFLL